MFETSPAFGGKPPTLRLALLKAFPCLTPRKNPAGATENPTCAAAYVDWLEDGEVSSFQATSMHSPAPRLRTCVAATRRCCEVFPAQMLDGRAHKSSDAIVVAR